MEREKIIERPIEPSNIKDIGEYQVTIKKNKFRSKKYKHPSPNDQRNFEKLQESLKNTEIDELRST